MGSRVLRLVVVLGTMAVAPAWAAERVVLAEIEGDDSYVLWSQLSATLCDTFECVPRAQVATDGKIDFRRMAAAGVSAVLLGTTVRRGGATQLTLVLVRTSDQPPLSWTFRLRAGPKLARVQLEQVRNDLVAAGRSSGAAAFASPGSGLTLAAPEPPARPRPPPAAGATTLYAGPNEAAPHASPAPPALPGAAGGATPPATNVARAPAPTAAPEGRAGQYLVAAGAGPFFTNRSLSYSGTPAGGQAPHGYDLALVSGPWVEAELFPFARATKGIAAGIGLGASFGTSTGFTSTSPDGEAVATLLWSLRAGAEWRLRPVEGSELAVVPALSYHRQTFELSPDFPGLPNSNLSGLEASLRLEVPVVRWLSLLAGGGYTYWFSAPDLLGPYFPDGSAWGFDAQGGLDVRIWGSLSLRALVLYSLTSYTLTPTDLYQPTAANDRSLGGRVTVRGAY